MGAKSDIEWTDASWTPIKARDKTTGKVGWHCVKLSPACAHCYAETFNSRKLPNGGTGFPYVARSLEKVEIFLDEKTLRQPLTWKKPRKIFVCSMTDLFADFVPDEMIDRVFAVMALCPQHTFQVLTKRADRMAAYLANLDRVAADWAKEVGSTSFDARALLNLRWIKANQRGTPATGFQCTGEAIPDGPWPLPNSWLGVSVENQQYAGERIPHLMECPAAVKFLSCEPILGQIGVQRWLGRRADMVPEHGIDWVIAGGESGHDARPMHPQWVRELRDQCVAAGVPFFFKQWGEWVGQMDAPPRCHAEYPFGRPGNTGEPMFRVGKKVAGRQLDEREWSEFPEVPRA